MARPTSEAPPTPRRIHLDATGWSVLRAAGAERGLPVEVLPETSADPARDAEVRGVLIAQALLDDTGAPTRDVHAALAVLTTAPVVVGAERVDAHGATRAVWRTAGVPTAGVVVRDRLEGDAAHQQVELQLLAVDDLVGLVLAELTGDDDARHEAAGGHLPGGRSGGGHLDAEDEVDDRSPVEVDADDVAALPPGLVRDGQLTARAAISVDGPGGTTVAQLLGDGVWWWQVGSAGPDRLRLLPVGATSLRASLVDALAGQLTAAAGAAAEGEGGGAGG
jgi:hypothetical protein